MVFMILKPYIVATKQEIVKNDCLSGCGKDAGSYQILGSECGKDAGICQVLGSSGIFGSTNFVNLSNDSCQPK